MSTGHIPNVRVRLVAPNDRFSTSVLVAPSLPQVKISARELLVLSDIRDGSGRRFSSSEYHSEAIAKARDARADCDIKVGDEILTGSEWSAKLGQHATAGSSTELLVFVDWAEPAAHA